MDSASLLSSEYYKRNERIIGDYKRSKSLTFKDQTVVNQTNETSRWLYTTENGEERYSIL